MTELTLVFKEKLPRYLVFPVTRQELEYYLNDLPQAEIRIAFSKGNRKSPKATAKPAHCPYILRASHSSGQWIVAVYSRYKDDCLPKIKEQMLDTGLHKLRDWLSQAARSDFAREGNLRFSLYAYFETLFDGENLLFEESLPFENKNSL